MTVATPPSATQRRPMTVVHEDAFLKVSHVSSGTAQNGRVLLSFTGLQFGLGGLDVQRPEFLKTGLGYDDAYFIFDLQRSWGNKLDFDVLNAILEPLIAGRPVDSVGPSMGGFNSILASGPLGIENCLSFGPQFSILDAIVPAEDRWHEYRAQIGDIKHPSLLGSFVADTNYTILFGDFVADMQHFHLFPQMDNLLCLSIPGLGHNVAGDLKQAGLLDLVTRRCLAGNVSADWFGKTLDREITTVRGNSAPTQCRRDADAVPTSQNPDISGATPTGDGRVLPHVLAPEAATKGDRNG